MKTIENYISRFICVLIFCFCINSVYAGSNKYIQECKIEQQNGKYGITFRGQQLVPFEYDNITLYKEGHFKVRQNNLFGIYTFVCQDEKQRGNYKISYPVVEIDLPMNNKYIYITHNVECLYDAIEDFDKDYISLKKDDKIGLLNQYYSTILPCRFEKIERNNPYLYVVSNKKQGVFNTYGSTIIPCQYDEITKKGSLFYLVKDGLKGVFNQYGSTILPCRYDEITNTENNYQVKANGKYGIFNQYGSTIIPCRFEKIQKVDNHYYVEENGKQGVFNQYGSTIIPTNYTKILKTNNKYLVENENKQGIFNQYGSTIIQCKYDEIKETGNKYLVRNDNLYGIFNVYGSTILSCKYSKIDFLANGQYITYIGDKKQLYNAYGSLISDYPDNEVIYSTSFPQK